MLACSNIGLGCSPLNPPVLVGSPENTSNEGYSFSNLIHIHTSLGQVVICKAVRNRGLIGHDMLSSRAGPLPRVLRFFLPAFAFLGLACRSPLPYAVRHTCLCCLCFFGNPVLFLIQDWLCLLMVWYSGSWFSHWMMAGVFLMYRDD